MVGQFIGGAVQSCYEQGYNNQDYQYQPLVEDLEGGGALVFLSFPFFCNFQLVFTYVCIVFSVFI
jgi:hypothetical protein